MTSATGTAGRQRSHGHVAARALGVSILVNVVATGLLYRALVPHFAAGSLMPLALSGAPPVIWLTFNLVKLRAIDFLGLFAIENTIVRITALLLANNDREALVGRAMENVLQSAMFIGSLCLARPIMLHIARQILTGNDPARRREFELAADQLEALAVYRSLTILWAVALLVKSAGGYVLALNCSTSLFLILSPTWELASDGVFLWMTLAYARRHLGSPSA